MNIRSALNALLGLWFLSAPWLAGHTEQTSVLWIHGVVGMIQIFAATAALYVAKGDSPPNLLTLVTGVAMAVLPFTVSNLPQPVNGISALLGVLTMLFSFANLSVRK